MEISNKERTKKIKRAFFLFILVLILVALYFVWKENDLGAVMSGGVGLLLLFVVPLANYNYIEYSSEGDKIIIRYYPIITFLTSKEYNSVEFNKAAFYDAQIKKNLFFSDLYISVKTKKGVAEYPEISCSALGQKQKEMLLEDLTKLKK